MLFVREERVGEVSLVLKRDREVVEKVKRSEERESPDGEVRYTWQEWFRP